MAEEIKIDLFDPANKDNQKFANLVDDAKWQKVISEYGNGLGEKSLAELFAEMLEGR